MRISVLIIGVTCLTLPARFAHATMVEARGVPSFDVVGFNLVLMKGDHTGVINFPAPEHIGATWGITGQLLNCKGFIPAQVAVSCSVDGFVGVNGFLSCKTQGTGTCDSIPKGIKTYTIAAGAHGAFSDDDTSTCTVGCSTLPACPDPDLRFHEDPDGGSPPKFSAYKGEKRTAWSGAWRGLPGTPLENVTFFHNGRRSTLTGAAGKARMGFVRIAADPRTNLSLTQLIEALAKALSVPPDSIRYEPGEGLPPILNSAFKLGDLLVAFDVPGLGFYGLSTGQEMSEPWYKRDSAHGEPVTITTTILHRVEVGVSGARWTSEPDLVMAPFASSLVKLCPRVDSAGFCLTEPGVSP